LYRPGGGCGGGDKHDCPPVYCTVSEANSAKFKPFSHLPPPCLACRQGGGGQGHPACLPACLPAGVAGCENIWTLCRFYSTPSVYTFEYVRLTLVGRGHLTVAQFHSNVCTVETREERTLHDELFYHAKLRQPKDSTAGPSDGTLGRWWAVN
jgi:hypothetical protein